MSRLVTIFGGSGFVGRYVARRMARAGWRVRVAVRRPNEAMFVTVYGAVGQVAAVPCNIRDDASVRAAAAGADAVVNCVGTFDAKGANGFDAVHVEGAARIARVAAGEGIARMVHLSAIGADPGGGSGYARSKGEGEAALRESQPGAAILRPSVVFGPEDGFFNRFAAMSRFGPVLPLVGAEARFQPVYVDDVARAAERALEDGAEGVFELGGPDAGTLRELVRRMLAVIRRRRLIVDLPFWAGDAIAVVSGAASALSLGALPPLITRDQVASLRGDSVVSDGARTLADLGIGAAAMDTVLPEYLWRFRPSGQYAAIKESAENLKA